LIATSEGYARSGKTEIGEISGEDPQKKRERERERERNPLRRCEVTRIDSRRLIATRREKEDERKREKERKRREKTKEREREEETRTERGRRK